MHDPARNRVVDVTRRRVIDSGAGWLRRMSRIASTLSPEQTVNSDAQAGEADEQRQYARHFVCLVQSNQNQVEREREHDRGYG
ncbi:hypothetical protein [Nonomuraea cavernae]|uniref:hypothetical protein n=1 Tax=Nonomuraea cavernae TaxID=2045107 RepID=UPI0033CC0C86